MKCGVWMIAVVVVVAAGGAARGADVLVLLEHRAEQRAALHVRAQQAYPPHGFASVEELRGLVGADASVVAAVRAFVGRMAPGAQVAVGPTGDSVVVSGLATRSAAVAVAAAVEGAVAGVDGFAADMAVVMGKGGRSGGAGRRGRARIVGAGGGVSPQAQRALLDIPDGYVAAAGVHQIVWGPGTFGYSASDLGQYYNAFSFPGNVSNVVAKGNSGTPGGDNFGEGELDATQSSSIGLGVPTWVWNTNASSATEEGPGFSYALAGFASMLAGAPESELPGVLSMSLGSLSYQSCNRLCTQLVAEHKLFSYAECLEYVQFKQRQVCMFVSAEVEARIEAELAKIAARGVTMVGASGDGGSHFSFQPFAVSLIGEALNKVACATNSPTYPASSAYVLGVGGLNPPSGSSSDQAPWPASGGGFSWDIPQPAWQAKAVAKYMSAAPSFPAAAAFNASGRAFPDIAILGNDVPVVFGGSLVVSGGTSASAPAAAGFISLIVNARAAAGKPSSGRLGLIAPMLYARDAEAPGTLFFDPTSVAPDANSACTSSGFCCPVDASFTAAPGFDVLTGLGRPVFGEWLKYFMSV